MSTVTARIADTAPAAAPRTTLLCVDDEPNVLAALGLHLRRRYTVLTAPGGAEALELLRREANIAVVMSDMRMPLMDGAAFLQAARELAPTATRILLTGQSDMASAIAAVNQGRIFRFLTKPCPPAELLAAVADAVQQHALVTAERVLLEQTLHGSIKTLTNLLALTNPPAFGRAVRVKTLVAELAERMELRERWQLEVAAMLLPLGMVSLSAATVEKIYYGQPLDADERQAVARCPAVTEQLLGNIPRLELVRETLATYWNPKSAGRLPLPAAQRELAELSAALLRAAMDFDVLEAQGHEPAVAIASMRAQSGHYLDKALDTLGTIRGSDQLRRQWLELPAPALRPGMVIAEDVKLPSGALLLPRGFEITESVVERLRTLQSGTLKGLVRVLV